MSPKQHQKTIKEQRHLLIKEIEEVYKKAFDRITKLNLGDGAIAKLSQAFLHSREEALIPLKKEIEKPLITKAPKNK